MPRGTTLSHEERGKILAYNELRYSTSVIARKINRSRCVVQNFLKNPDNYNTCKRTGRKLLLSARERRSILRKASNSSASCSTLAASVRKKVSKSTIWRTLQQCKHLKLSKMKKEPRLLPRHKVARLTFAENHLSTDWRLVRKKIRLKHNPFLTIFV